MKRILNSLSIACLALILLTCKKKPDLISVVVYNPIIGEYISNAEVSLIEFSFSGGLFSASGNCNTIKKAMTDDNGEANLTGAKLKKDEKYHYFIVVSNCYGKTVPHSCANYPSSNYLNKTSNSINKKIYYYAKEVEFTINIDGLNSGGFSTDNTDSIGVRIFRDFPYTPDFDNSQLNGSKQEVGGTSLTTSMYHLLYYPTPLPETYSVLRYDVSKIYPGKYKLEVCKRKSGVVTTYTYNETVLPVDRYNLNSITW